MAKAPSTPKAKMGAKTGAPAQFDMNSRERKGGKGGKGGPSGPGRGRDDKRPPSQIVNLPPAVVDRGQGWVIQKIGKIDQASHTALGAEYNLIFEGHDALVFDRLGLARERAKEAPPEHAPADAAEPIDDAADTEASVSVESGAEHEPGEAQEGGDVAAVEPGETQDS